MSKYTPIYTYSNRFETSKANIMAALEHLRQLPDKKELVQKLSQFDFSEKYYLILQEADSEIQPIPIPWKESESQAETDEQLHDYHMSVLTSSSESKGSFMSEENLLLGAARRPFDLGIDEYRKLFKEIDNTLAQIAADKDSKRLEGLIKEFPDVSGVFYAEKSKFAKTAIENGSLEVLQLLLSTNKDFNFSELLTYALEKAQNKDYRSVESIINTCSELSRILEFLQSDSSKYFYKDAEVKEVFIKRLNSIDSKYADHYEAMYAYSLGDHKKTIVCFDKAIKNNVDNKHGLLPIDYLFRGLCKQYSVNNKEAKLDFEYVMKSGASKIKDIAEKHLASLENTNKLQEKIVSFLSTKPKDGTLSVDYFKEIEAGLKDISENITDSAKVTEKKNKLTGSILKSRYEGVKSRLKEQTKDDESVLLYEEFKTIPQLANRYKDIISKKGLEAIHKNYQDTVKYLDDALCIIGEVTGGVIIEEVI